MFRPPYGCSNEILPERKINVFPCRLTNFVFLGEYLKNSQSDSQVKEKTFALHCTWDLRKKLITAKGIKHWNRVPRELSATFPEVSKRQVGEVPGDMA